LQRLLRSGAFLPPGRLKLQAGVAEVAFLSGASVRPQGPAELEVQVNVFAMDLLVRPRLVGRVESP
jgi:hypothetical protein